MEGKTMSILRKKELVKIIGKDLNANALSFLRGLDAYGFEAGLDGKHRLAMYTAQCCHESMAFRYDQEVWGPTPAQKRYDTRTDLGNTPERDGDGYRYRGRAGIQITGKANYTEFTKWCRKRFPNCPDFVKNPDAILQDPWEGLVPIWYWSTRNLNKYADRGHFREVTRRINGGYNGYKDRVRYFERAGLVLLGYHTKALLDFQRNEGLNADGVFGPRSQTAMVEALKATSVPRNPVASPPPRGGLLKTLMDILGGLFK